MVAKEYKIREVKLEDAERLAEIYSYYVQNTAVSFEYQAPSASEFEDRIRKTVERYPYIVCTYNDRVVGYAYAEAYSTREAYNWTVTSSIYIDKAFRRKRIGSVLYVELEKKLKKLGIVNILAGVAYSENEDEYLSHDSMKFHLKEGYTQVAHMPSIGKKFGRWYDLLWLQKKI